MINESSRTHLLAWHGCFEAAQLTSSSLIMEPTIIWTVFDSIYMPQIAWPASNIKKVFLYFFFADILPLNLVGVLAELKSLFNICHIAFGHHFRRKNKNYRIILNYWLLNKILFSGFKACRCYRGSAGIIKHFSQCSQKLPSSLLISKKIM